MLPYAHFLFGSLTSYLKKRPERTLFMFLTLGFLGIAPDFDFIPMKLLNWENFHRNWSHSIIAWIIGGIITLYLFRSFWPGFLAVASHFVLDLIDFGNVAIIPGIKVALPNAFYNGVYLLFGYSGQIEELASKNVQLWASTILGTFILMAMIIMEWRANEKK